MKLTELGRRAWSRRPKVLVALLVVIIVASAAGVTSSAAAQSPAALQNIDVCDTANSDAASARPIQPGEIISDALCEENTQDWYRFEVPAGAFISADIFFIDAESDVDLALHDPTGTRRASSTSTSDNESVGPITAGIAGEWTIRVYDWYQGRTGGASYEVTVEVSEVEFFEDADADGFGDPDSQSVFASTAPEGFVGDNTDCDDTDAGINPAAEDGVVPDGVDNDCDDAVDEDYVPVEVMFYADTDADTFGDPNSATETGLTAAVDGVVVQPTASEGFVADNTDCDDTDAAINPAADDGVVPDGIDNDCDDEIDEDYVPVEVTFYADADVDTFGDPESTSVAVTAAVDGVVVQPAASEGFVADNTDCNDGNDAINPGVAEDGVEPDGVDNDCDDEIDEDYVPVEVMFYADTDSDTFGDPESTSVAVTAAVDGVVVQPAAPEGFVADNTDCDDSDETVFPGADEVPGDDVDQNCDGEDRARVLSISGRVFGDTNRDGVADADEDDVSGVVVDLFSAGTDGVLDTDDDELVATATTASPYEFFDIADGEYLIVIDPTTLPAGLSVGGDGSVSVEVLAGSVALADFAQEYAQISSTLVDSAGAVIADTLVTLTDSAGNEFTARTNSAGEFVIEGSAGAPLAQGSATVEFLVGGTSASVTVEVAGATTQVARLAAPISQTLPVLAFTGPTSEGLIGFGLFFLGLGVALLYSRQRFVTIEG